MTRWRIGVLIYSVLVIVAALLTGPLVIAELCIVAAALFAWVFIFMYLRTLWKETSVGKQIMSTWIFLALLTTISLIPESFGFDGTLREWVALVILASMPVLTLNMIRLLRREQRVGHKITKKEEKNNDNF